MTAYFFSVKNRVVYILLSIIGNITSFSGFGGLESLRDLIIHTNK